MMIALIDAAKQDFSCNSLARSKSHFFTFCLFSCLQTSSTRILFFLLLLPLRDLDSTNLFNVNRLALPGKKGLDVTSS